jgi:hypothetical protein
MQCGALSTVIIQSMSLMVSVHFKLQKNHTCTYFFQDNGKVNIPFCGKSFTVTAKSCLSVLWLLFSPLLLAFPTEKQRTK